VPVDLSKELLEKAEKLQGELNAIQDDESEKYSEGASIKSKTVWNKSRQHRRSLPQSKKQNPG